MQASLAVLCLCRPVYYYVFAVFTTLFYSKLRPTFEPDYSTLEQTSFFQNLFVQKGTYRDDMSKGLKIMSLGVINHGMSFSVLYHYSGEKYLGRLFCHKYQL